MHVQPKAKQCTDQATYAISHPTPRDGAPGERTPHLFAKCLLESLWADRTLAADQRVVVVSWTRHQGGSAHPCLSASSQTSTTKYPSPPATKRVRTASGAALPSLNPVLNPGRLPLLRRRVRRRVHRRAHRRAPRRRLRPHHRRLHHQRLCPQHWSPSSPSSRK